MTFTAALHITRTDNQITVTRTAPTVEGAKRACQDRQRPLLDWQDRTYIDPSVPEDEDPFGGEFSNVVALAEIPGGTFIIFPNE